MPTKELGNGNVYLMGFMGCGKSRVGKLLAEHLGWPFIDTDEMIVQETSKSIPELFNDHGENGFRQHERSCIDRVSRLRGHVVSLGGGAVLDPGNWEKISNSGFTITLSYPLKIIASRLSASTDRPLLNTTEDSERLKKIENLMSQREPFYRKADFELHMNREVPAERIAKMLLSYLKDRP